MLVGYIALILSGVAVVMALLAPYYREMTLMRAFKRLERDVDDMWEKVEAHLGRISRLKRTLVPKEGASESLPGGVQGDGRPLRPQAMITRRDLLRRYRAAGRTQ